MKKIGLLKLKDHMTDDEKMKYLVEKIEILQSIMEKEGDEVCKVKRIELTDKKHTYGSCSYIGKKTVILEFSRRNFVEGNDDNLNNTIAHELIHAMVGVPTGHDVFNYNMQNFWPSDAVNDSYEDWINETLTPHSKDKLIKSIDFILGDYCVGIDDNPAQKENYQLISYQII